MCRRVRLVNSYGPSRDNLYVLSISLRPLMPFLNLTRPSYFWTTAYLLDKTASTWASLTSLVMTTLPMAIGRT